jgi:hypothetical protein
MAQHWTFNGSIQNLQIFLYAPPGHSPTGLTPVSQDSDAPPPRRHETQREETTPGIKEEDTQCHGLEGSFCDKKLSPSAASTKSLLPNEQAIHDNCDGARDDTSDYLNVFMRSLPWGEPTSAQNSNQVPPRLKADNEDEYGEIPISGLPFYNHQPKSSAPTSGNFCEIIATNNERNQPTFATTSPHHLDITYDDLQSDTSGDTSVSSEPDSPCPRRASAIRPRRKTRRSSSYFARIGKDDIPYIPRRKIVIAEPSVRRSQVTHSEFTSNLTENLRRIECAPNHKWTHDEKELLCTVRRKLSHL